MKMKKNYLKPDIFFEDFAFSSNIAAACSKFEQLHSPNGGCQMYANFAHPNSCSFVDHGWTIFESTNTCIQVPQEYDPNNLCFHVSTDDTRMFAS
jgi:hypothetical protein